MQRLVGFCLFLCAVCVPLQAQHADPASLPMHKGAMLLDLADWKVTESSAKPGGKEIGVRAHSTQSNMGMLAFLFLTPESPHQTAASCREGELEEIARQHPKHMERSDGPNGSAMADVSFSDHETVHAFWGNGDQCLSIEVYPDPKNTLNVTAARSFLARQKYNPDATPRIEDKLVYAEVLYRKHAYAAVVPIYRDLLANLPATANNLTMRRVVTDNLGMSLGISGDIAGARALFQQAIAVDPQYPLNYYNLACADAEEGKAGPAKEHLQLAFDRRKNLISGEPFPDPIQDDSLQKLKSDKDFWKLATSISEQIKKPETISRTK